MVIAHIAIACYHPETRDCTLQCSAPTDCAGEQVCSGGWCAADGIRCTKDGQPITVDAAVNNNRPDAATSNALCQQGCTKGTCENGVCVIDCTATDACSESDVICPSNLPCRVLCGDEACAKKIHCEHSSSCDVRCTGETSCRDEIICPDGACTVLCSGTGSCKKTKCTDSCSCNVTCSGAGACTDPSECPMSACKIGNACSALPAGCNTCS